MARLGQHALILWVAVTLNFALPRLMPGSPLALLAGAELAALTADERAALQAEAGLDRSLPVQYARYLANLARGDLGYSYQRGEPVGAILAARLPWTLLLTGTSQVVALLLGVTLGAWSARRHGRWSDAGLLGAVMCLESLPVFWVGMVLVALFAVQMPIFPTFGATTPWMQHQGPAWIRDVGHHLVLPLVTLTVASLSSTFLVARSVVAALLDEPFVTAARARGMGGRQVLIRHVVPNALPAVATVAVMNLAFVVGGATLVETVFSYPGVGRLVYESVLNRDYPVLQSAFLLLTVVVVAGSVLIDACYPWLDPRVRVRPKPAPGAAA